MQGKSFGAETVLVKSKGQKIRASMFFSQIGFLYLDFEKISEGSRYPKGRT